jgi:hypothetical protein
MNGQTNISLENCYLNCDPQLEVFKLFLISDWQNGKETIVKKNSEPIRERNLRACHFAQNHAWAIMTPAAIPTSMPRGFGACNCFCRSKSSSSTPHIKLHDLNHAAWSSLYVVATTIFTTQVKNTHITDNNNSLFETHRKYPAEWLQPSIEGKTKTKK